MLATVCTILFQELRILRRDPTPFTVLFIMPALSLILFTPALGAMLREQGHSGVSGIELALPGMTVMFGSLGAAFLGFAIFREHQWQTWPRLLSGPTSVLSILFGKMLVPTFLVLGQQLMLLLLAMLAYDVTVPEAWGLYLANALGFAINVSSLGLLAAAFCHSLQQMNAIIHLAAILLAASCGAFIPLEQMPAWAQFISTLTPSHWIVNSQLAVLLAGDAQTTSIKTLAVLLSQALTFCLLASLRFQANERKYNWT